MQASCGLESFGHTQAPILNNLPWHDSTTSPISTHETLCCSHCCAAVRTVRNLMHCRPRISAIADRNIDRRQDPGISPYMFDPAEGTNRLPGGPLSEQLAGTKAKIWTEDRSCARVQTGLAAGVPSQSGYKWASGPVKHQEVSRTSRRRRRPCLTSPAANLRVNQRDSHSGWI